MENATPFVKVTTESTRRVRIIRPPHGNLYAIRLAVISRIDIVQRPLGPLRLYLNEARLTMDNLSGLDISRRGLRLRPNNNIVAQRAGAGILLIHLQTNRIYELNSTASRLWEVLSDGSPPAQMLVEFDVAEAQFNRELAAFISLLVKEDLLIEHDDKYHI
jgi:Coenzyme PQQ synthesis protein D (PqqD)